MNKRVKRFKSDDKSRKKYKVSQTILDPHTSGIYASCSRRHEKHAAQELLMLFEDKLEEYYKDELNKIDAEENPKDIDKDETNLSIEDKITKELEEIKNKTKTEKSKEIIQQIDLQCECIIFFKTRKPIIPEKFVYKIMEDFLKSEFLKRTRYIQKLTPITYSCSASIFELEKLAKHVLEPHFHKDKTPLKFAIEVNRRNFNTIEKMDIINLIANEIGKNKDILHKVDLKNYDKLVLVQCFKNNIGMSVVNHDYSTKFKRYNLQELFDSKFKLTEKQSL